MDEKKSYQILQFALDRDGYVSVSEARRFGIAQTYLVLAEQEGQFDKVAKGLYVKKGYPIDPYYILHYRYPKALFCLESACYLHKWLSSEPKAMQVKLPRNYMTKGVEGCLSHHESLSSFSIGVGIGITPNGQFVSLTDKERTIVDLLLHQEDFDKAYLKSILEKALSDSIDWEVLRHYGELFKIEKAIDALSIFYEENEYHH